MKHGLKPTTIFLIIRAIFFDIDVLYLRLLIRNMKSRKEEKKTALKMILLYVWSVVLINFATGIEIDTFNKASLYVAQVKDQESKVED